jgi:putative aldouronate transport system substrate-binding protein
MKKFLILFLSIVTVLPAFAGGRNAGTSGTSGGTSRTGVKGSIPLATNNPVLTMFVPGMYADNLTSADYRDNAFTKKIVDETGIQLQVTSTTEADATERLNLMLNTGDYPDIIGGYFFNVDYSYYGRQGIFIPLDANELRTFPYIKRALDLYPAAMDKMVSPDGNIYGLPIVDVCNHCVQSDGRTWFYMPWIRDNNLKVPETAAEFADYLRFVKNNDVNKNGKRDEVGMAFTSGQLGNVVAFFAKSFMPYVGGYALDSSRKIVEQHRDDRFRAALAYMAELYKEGLIVEDSFSMTVEQLQALARQDDPTVAVLGDTWVNNIVPNGNERQADYLQLLPMKTSDGQRYGINTDPWASIGIGYFITDKCKDPELAIALYDYFQHDDVIKSAYGPKGVFWDDPDPGALGADGNPAYWKWLIPFGTEPLNSHWGNHAPHVWLPEMRLGIQADGVDTAIRYLTTWDKNLKPVVQANNSFVATIRWEYGAAEAKKYALPDDLFVPPANMSTADSTRVGDIEAVLNPYKSQAWVEFITGVRDVNNNAQWNTYLADLDRLGSKELVSIRQKYVK